mmetsp:Transcript_27990/g.65745  ORF Transcript_27990/g.65745 Transcript_27990/m.65745 type:complete len:202 (-) Transcript_27990:480-1085(-)
MHGDSQSGRRISGGAPHSVFICGQTAIPGTPRVGSRQEIGQEEPGAISHTAASNRQRSTTGEPHGATGRHSESSYSPTQSSRMTQVAVAFPAKPSAHCQLSSLELVACSLTKGSGMGSGSMQSSKTQISSIISNSRPAMVFPTGHEPMTPSLGSSEGSRGHGMVALDMLVTKLRLLSLLKLLKFSSSSSSSCSMGGRMKPA